MALGEGMLMGAQRERLAKTDVANRTVQPDTQMLRQRLIHHTDRRLDPTVIQAYCTDLAETVQCLQKRMDVHTLLLTPAWACKCCQQLQLQPASGYWIYIQLARRRVNFENFVCNVSIHVHRADLRVRRGGMGMPGVRGRESGLSSPLAVGEVGKDAELRAGTGSFAAIFCPTKRRF
ncbi:hypothetical protein JZ751_003455 [Albula glossodonta]|uniref:Uncharacterized protein n=1 Tax=Albula glossodonta TaxID=121402 RepID=A0A8T2MR02_9TELE|nr:hypothetical protein JZ751_003455 [Albula glossodonta]